jgi:CBS domain-containing protein
MNTKLSVKELMTPNPFVLQEGQDLSHAWKLFSENKISGAPVVDEKGILVGVLSQADLLRFAFDNHFADFPQSSFCISLPFQEGALINPPIDRLSRISVDEAMHQGAVAVTTNDSLSLAAECMRTNKIHRVVVVDDQSSRRVVGILSALDLLKVF